MRVEVEAGNKGNAIRRVQHQTQLTFYSRSVYYFVEGSSAVRCEGIEGRLFGNLKHTLGSVLDVYLHARPRARDGGLQHEPESGPEAWVTVYCVHTQ